MLINRWIHGIGLTVLALLLIGCSKENIDPPNDIELDVSPDEMIDQMLKEINRPDVIELNAEQIEEFYEVDVDLLEEYSVHVPMLYVRTDEISIVKAKDQKDVEGIEKALRKRAKDVQEQFENEYPDQYEYAKNYIIKTKGRYTLFVISKEADTLLEMYERFFPSEE